MSFQMNVKAVFAGLTALAVAAIVFAPQSADARRRGGRARLEIKLPMVNVNPAVDPDAKGVARFRKRSDRTRFSVHVKRLEPGRYDLLVGDTFQAFVDVGELGDGETKFATDVEPGKLPLEFDPRGQVVEVAQGETVLLSIAFPADSSPVTTTTTTTSSDSDRRGRGRGRGRGHGARVDDGNSHARVRLRIETDLATTGELPGAAGKARFRSKRGRDRANVEIENVPDGDDYTLRVDGVEVAAIVVTLGEGEVEFDTKAKNGKLPLTFDPRGKLVEVIQGSTVILQVVFPQS